jgi:hypothetical protein
MTGLDFPKIPSGRAQLRSFQIEVLLVQAFSKNLAFAVSPRLSARDYL